MNFGFAIYVLDCVCPIEELWLKASRYTTNCGGGVVTLWV